MEPQAQRGTLGVCSLLASQPQQLIQSLGQNGVTGRSRDSALSRSVVLTGVPPGKRSKQGHHRHAPLWSKPVRPEGAQEGEDSRPSYGHQTVAVPPGEPRRKGAPDVKQDSGPRQARCMRKERPQEAPAGIFPPCWC